MVIQDACEIFIVFCEQTKKLSPHTIKAYRRDLKTFIEIAGPNTKIEIIDRKSINTYVNALFAQGLSKATVKRRLACLKSLFKRLENEDLIDHSPFYRLDLKIRLPQRLPRNLSVQELNKLLSTSKAKLGLPRKSDYEKDDFGTIEKRNINNLSTLLCTELLFATGIRVGELTDIYLSDIYLNEKYIHIRGKGQRERRVFITDNSIQNLIKSYIHYRKVTNPNHEKLLVNSRGRPATAQIVRIWIKKVSKLACLNRTATPHMYRHSTATELLSSGVDIVYVQKLLGHQSISTTQIYAHINHVDLFNNILKANIRRDIL
ncbi:MAG: tyrosine-type recombinase/integrase [Candidatus Thiodiazotropha sp.]